MPTRRRGGKAETHDGADAVLSERALRIAQSADGIGAVTHPLGSPER